MVCSIIFAKNCATLIIIISEMWLVTKGNDPQFEFSRCTLLILLLQLITSDVYCIKLYDDL